MTRRPRKIDLNHLIWTLPPPSTGVKVVTRESVKVRGDGVRVLGHLRSCLSGCRAGTGSERGSRCGGEQYSSTPAEYRVQSTEYRRGGTAAACWSEHQRLQRLEITTRLWSNALVISDCMQIEGGVFESYSEVYVWYTWFELISGQCYRSFRGIYNLFL